MRHGFFANWFGEVEETYLAAQINQREQYFRFQTETSYSAVQDKSHSATIHMLAQLMQKKRPNQKSKHEKHKSTRDYACAVKDAIEGGLVQRNDKMQLKNKNQYVQQQDAGTKVE